MLIECGANLPDGWQRGISTGGARQTEEKSQFFAEHLLNNKFQMGTSSATEKVLTLTKQMKIDLCETGQGELANRRQLHCPFQRAVHALLE